MAIVLAIYTINFLHPGFLLREPTAPKDIELEQNRLTGENAAPKYDS